MIRCLYGSGEVWPAAADWHPEALDQRTIFYCCARVSHNSDSRDLTGLPASLRRQCGGAAADVSATRRCHPTTLDALSGPRRVGRRDER